MASDIDIEKLPAQAQRLFAPNAPAGPRLLAARGVVPGLKPAEIVTVLALLAEADDATVRSTADATLSQLPPPILSGALTADLAGSVIERLSQAYSQDHSVIEALLRMPRITLAAVEHLADRADERAGEIIATNEELMLKNPTVIEKLYMNRRVRMSTADRLIELAVRNGLELGFPAFKEAAAAIRNELIPVPSEAPTFDDVLFQETEAIAAQADVDEKDPDTHEVDDEGQEKVKDKFLPLHAQIAQMTVSQKIRRAILGSSAERLLLVRDNNRLVATAAVKSPMFRENEAAQVSASRSVTEEVLRVIAQNREFMRSYQIKLNLVSNPRTPFTFAARLVPHLRESDLRSMVRSKNVSGAVAQAIQAQIGRKKNK